MTMTMIIEGEQREMDKDASRRQEGGALRWDDDDHGGGCNMEGERDKGDWHSSVVHTYEHFIIYLLILIKSRLLYTHPHTHIYSRTFV